MDTISVLLSQQRCRCLTVSLSNAATVLPSLSCCLIVAGSQSLAHCCCLALSLSRYLIVAVSLSLSLLVRHLLFVRHLANQEIEAMEKMHALDPGGMRRRREALYAYAYVFRCSMQASVKVTS